MDDRDAHFKQRLKVLEQSVNGKGIILSDAQAVALEKKRYEDEISGALESAYVGYLGSQDSLRM